MMKIVYHEKQLKHKIEKKIILTIFVLSFVIFLFTSDGHRFSLDEDITHQQTIRIVTQEPHPLYFEGETRMLFEYPLIYQQRLLGPICQDPIFCSAAKLGHSLTQVPFYFINYHLNIITVDNFQLTQEHFEDIPYILWRNSLDPNTIFLELFYGPLFSALSVLVFFKISRTFSFSIKISLILTLLFAFTTMIWAYSNTSLNVVPEIPFILISYFFFRRFQSNNESKNLLFCGASLGFSYLIRPDAILFAIPLLFLLLFELKIQSQKIKKFLSYSSPLIIAFFVTILMEFVNFGFYKGYSSPISAITSLNPVNPPLAILGLLLSPGVGLFIFSPILLTIFFSFPDFYKKNKKEVILFLSTIILFLIYYGNLEYWHGMLSWGARYLLLLTPFMLIPLGATLEKTSNKIIMISIIFLALLGVIFNLVYVLQDVPWFVWDFASTSNGLYALGSFGDSPLGINLLTLWTFEYSQLTHSILLAFTNFQPDVLLLIVMGPILFLIILAVTITPLSYFLIRSIKKIKN